MGSFFLSVRIVLKKLIEKIKAVYVCRSINTRFTICKILYSIAQYCYLKLKIKRIGEVISLYVLLRMIVKYTLDQLLSIYIHMDKYKLN